VLCGLLERILEHQTRAEQLARGNVVGVARQDRAEFAFAVAPALACHLEAAEQHAGVYVVGAEFEQTMQFELGIRVETLFPEHLRQFEGSRLEPGRDAERLLELPRCLGGVVLEARTAGQTEETRSVEQSAEFLGRRERLAGLLDQLHEVLGAASALRTESLVPEGASEQVVRVGSALIAARARLGDHLLDLALVGEFVLARHGLLEIGAERAVLVEPGECARRRRDGDHERHRNG